MQNLGQPRGERWRRWFDIGLVLVLVMPAVLLVILAEDSENTTLGLLSVAQVLPLLWRRKHSTAVFVAVCAASVVQLPLLDFPIPGQVAFPIAVYSAARWSPWSTKVLAIVVSMCAALVAGWDWTNSYATDIEAYIAPVLSNAGIAGTAWALGLAGSQRDGLIASLVERAEQAHRMGQRDVALAAQDERSRIAREMHDVVAHGLSVMVVQADGARYAAARDPAVAITALETIAGTGRESLSEMRRLLGLLRTGDSGTRPQPRTSDIQHLVAQARDSGMTITAELPEGLDAVPEGIGLAVYRVVQEALTNVRKHAGARARVHLRVGLGRDLTVEVTDDGHGAAASSDPGDGAGLGLVGMRERVGVHGGSVVAGPVTGGGWRVLGRIPL